MKGSAHKESESVRGGTFAAERRKVFSARLLSCLPGTPSPKVAKVVTFSLRPLSRREKSAIIRVDRGRRDAHASGRSFASVTCATAERVFCAKCMVMYFLLFRNVCSIFALDKFISRTFRGVPRGRPVMTRVCDHTSGHRT